MRLPKRGLWTWVCQYNHSKWDDVKWPPHGYYWLLTAMGSFVIGFYHITLVQVPKSGSKVSHARDEELSASHPSCSRSWEWNPPPEWGSLPRLRKHRDNLGECGRRSCRVNQRRVWCWFRFPPPPLGEEIHLVSWWKNDQYDKCSVFMDFPYPCWFTGG